MPPRFPAPILLVIIYKTEMFWFFRRTPLSRKRRPRISTTQKVQDRQVQANPFSEKQKKQQQQQKRKKEKEIVNIMVEAKAKSLAVTSL